MDRLTILRLVILTSIAAMGCLTKTPTYDWEAAACTPANFPCKVLYSSLICRDGSAFRLPFRYKADEGWAQVSSLSVTGDDEKPLPVALDIRFFAARERKCYEGSFTLPPGVIESAFALKYPSAFNDRMNHLDMIVVGMAPGGNVVIWAVGESRSIEIGMFQAKETPYDTLEFIDGNSSVEAVVASLSDGSKHPDTSIPDFSNFEVAKYAGIYRQRYDWTPVFHCRQTVTGTMLRYFNGEVRYEPDTAVWGTHSEQTVPSLISAKWEALDGERHSAMLQFDERLIFRAFDSLASLSPGQRLQLHIELGNHPEAITAFLTDGRHQVALSPRAGSN